MISPDGSMPDAMNRIHVEGHPGDVGGDLVLLGPLQSGDLHTGQADT